MNSNMNDIDIDYDSVVTDDICVCGCSEEVVEKYATFCEEDGSSVAAYLDVVRPNL